MSDVPYKIENDGLFIRITLGATTVVASYVSAAQIHRELGMALGFADTRFKGEMAAMLAREEARRLAKETKAEAKRQRQESPPGDTP